MRKGGLLQNNKLVENMIINLQNINARYILYITLIQTLTNSNIIEFSTDEQVLTFSLIILHYHQKVLIFASQSDIRFEGADWKGKERLILN